MLVNLFKFIDDFKNKGVGYGWNVCLLVLFGKFLNCWFLIRDYGSYEEVLCVVLVYCDEMCKLFLFLLYVWVFQYFDGMYKVIQVCCVVGKLKVCVQWVEFDLVLGVDCMRNFYCIVLKLEDYEVVYVEVEVLVKFCIICEVECVVVFVVVVGGLGCEIEVLVFVVLISVVV